MMRLITEVIAAVAVGYAVSELEKVAARKLAEVNHRRAVLADAREEIDAIADQVAQAWVAGDGGEVEWYEGPWDPAEWEEDES